jgi:hypothetical protein
VPSVAVIAHWLTDWVTRRRKPAGRGGGHYAPPLVRPLTPRTSPAAARSGARAEVRAEVTLPAVAAARSGATASVSLRYTGESAKLRLLDELMEQAERLDLDQVQLLEPQFELLGDVFESPFALRIGRIYLSMAPPPAGTEVWTYEVSPVEEPSAPPKRNLRGPRRAADAA